MTMVREAQELYLDNCLFRRPYMRMHNEYTWFMPSGIGRVRDYKKEEMIDKGMELMNRKHEILLLDRQRCR